MKDEKAHSELTEKEKNQVIRLNEAFTFLRNHKSTADAVALLMKRFPGISRATAYRDCADAISLFGDISKSSKEGIRHLTTEMIRDAYQIAYRKNDVDAMIRAASAIAKINGVNLNDPDQIDWEQIEPHTYVLGIDEQMIKAFKSMLKGGKIDLTNVVNAMNAQAEEAIIIEDKGALPNGS